MTRSLRRLPVVSSEVLSAQTPVRTAPPQVPTVDVRRMLVNEDDRTDLCEGEDVERRQRRRWLIKRGRFDDDAMTKRRDQRVLTLIVVNLSGHQRSC